MNLVTGATGHIGNVLIRKLLERGEKVRALIWRGEDDTPLRGLDVERVEGDVLDPDSLRAALRGVETVEPAFGLPAIWTCRPSSVESLGAASKSTSPESASF